MASKTGLNFAERIKRLKKIASDAGCDAVLVEDSLNLYYLTGMELSRGVFAVKNGAQCLFVDGRYIDACKSAYAGDVAPYGEEVSFFSGCKKIAIDRHAVSIDAFEGRKCELPVEAISFEALRMVKDPNEIALLKQSADLLREGMDYAKGILKVGMTELDAVREFEFFCRKAGASSLSFDPIVAFGKGGAQPHYKPSDVKLKDNDVVLFDAGVVWKHYCSDRTRTFVFGTPSEKFLEIDAIVKAAYDAAIAVTKPGATIGELNRAARGVIEKAGYGDRFIHGLGHGVGLEVHDFPYMARKEVHDLKLEVGMVLAIEPGIYLENDFGIRHENTIVVTDNGSEIV
ncbi:MAG: Xaa-Pro peptidase family protein [Simkaniaceae bacterium]|nr:Xaa-Pro peptidase family protein [Simkaniaceae bacterium]